MLDPLRQNPVRSLLFLLLGIVLIMRVDMIFRFEINWDEFLNLSMIHDYARGDLHEVLQTAFVHLFFWLPAISENEVDQVIAGRFLVLVFALITSLAIYKTSRKFNSIEASLFSVVAYWAFTFTLRHGVSLRTDPLATCALMVAIWVVVYANYNWRYVAFAGICIAVAGVMTIKAALYIPAIVCVALFSLLNGISARHTFLILAAGMSFAISVFSVLVWMHMIGFEQSCSPVSFITRTSSTTVGVTDFSTVRDYLPYAFKRNFAFFFLLLLGGLITFGLIKDVDTRTRGLCLIGFLLPLLTPLVYSEIYPYYYPFMLAPVVVVIGVGFEHILKNKSLIFSIGVIATVFGPALVFYDRSIQQGLDAQRRTLTVIHEIFPHPVPYIDARSMVSSYPKRGLFMSKWGMRDYRDAGQLIMRDVLSVDQPQFLLANKIHLDLEVFTPERSENSRLGLFGDDLKVLQDNFVHYWGSLYVPGFKMSGGEDTLTVLISGRYELLSGDQFTIDGNTVFSGEMVTFDEGVYQVHHDTDITLRLALPDPPKDEITVNLFRGF